MTPSGCSSHNRVDVSRSVKRKVTVPVGSVATSERYRDGGPHASKRSRARIERCTYDAAVFMLRFDMRAPTEGPAAIGDLYAAAIEMSVWAEQHGALSVVLSEHHASPDGYLPSPLVLASAIAART